jgi:hypothetical protein
LQEYAAFASAEDVAAKRAEQNAPLLFCPMPTEALFNTKDDSMAVKAVLE